MTTSRSSCGATRARGGAASCCGAPSWCTPSAASPARSCSRSTPTTAPGNRLIADDVRAVFAALTACAPAFEGTLGFVPSSNEQRQTATLVQTELAAEGIAVILE